MGNPPVLGVTNMVFFMSVLAPNMFGTNECIPGHGFNAQSMLPLPNVRYVSALTLPTTCEEHQHCPNP